SMRELVGTGASIEQGHAPEQLRGCIGPGKAQGGELATGKLHLTHPQELERAPEAGRVILGPAQERERIGRGLLHRLRPCRARALRVRGVEARVGMEHVIREGMLAYDALVLVERFITLTERLLRSREKVSLARCVLVTARAVAGPRERGTALEHRR